MKTSQRRQRSGFTLIEILVVLSIIALLAALLFPAFSRARESGRQTNCASNLNQIYVAVQQYFQDERAYPDSLVDLLPEGAKFNDGTPGGVIDKYAGGYLKSDRILSCQNDATNATLPRSSYGALTKNITATNPDAADPSRSVWNYWGYDDKGYAYPIPTNPGDTKYLVDPAEPFTSEEYVKGNGSIGTVNPIAASLSNRYADPATIITHCVFHRPQTATSLSKPTDLYTDPDGKKSNLARDIVLRLDGSARSTDVSKWKDSDLWRLPTN